MLLSGTGILNHMKFRLSLRARVVRPPLFEQCLGLMNAPYNLLLIYHTTDVPFMSTVSFCGRCATQCEDCTHEPR